MSSWMIYLFIFVIVYMISVHFIYYFLRPCVRIALCSTFASIKQLLSHFFCFFHAVNINKIDYSCGPITEWYPDSDDGRVETSVLMHPPKIISIRDSIFSGGAACSMWHCKVYRKTTRVVLCCNYRTPVVESLLQTMIQIFMMQVAILYVKSLTHCINDFLVFAQHMDEFTMQAFRPNIFSGYR